MNAVCRRVSPNHSEVHRQADGLDLNQQMETEKLDVHGI